MPDKVISGIFKFDENVAATAPLSPKKSISTKKSSSPKKSSGNTSYEDDFCNNPFFFQ